MCVVVCISGLYGEKASATVSVYFKCHLFYPFCAISVFIPFSLLIYTTLPFKCLGSVRFF